LDISNNNLGEFPSFFKRLTNLTHLDLSDTNLHELSLKIGDLINLRHLNVEHNQVRVLPVSLGNLANLEQFQLDRIALSQHAQFLSANESNLRCYWKWSPATHANFSIQVRRVVKMLFLASRSEVVTCKCFKLPKEILAHILSFFLVDNVIQMTIDN
jgi:hypothetical protein